MRHRSLFFSVIFIGTVSFFAIIVLFAFFIKEDSLKHVENVFERYQIIRSILLHREGPLTNENLDRQLEQFSMHVVDENLKQAILNSSKILKVDKRKLVTQTLFPSKNLFISRQEIELNIGLISAKQEVYFYLQTPFGDVLIHDKKSRPYNYFIALIPLALVASLQLFFFTFILLKLYPLRKIAQTLERFGAGDLSVRLDIKGNNEIAEISDAFNRAVKQIDALIENRTLFMRNVMHELKTPIAKGRILAQVLDEKEQKRFDTLFIRLQNLLDDFALIDQVNSFLNIDNSVAYSFRDLLDEAIEVSMIEEEKISIQELGHIKKEVDYTLYVTVFKNLLDNAIKYSIDSQVSVVINNEYIDFISKGEALKNELAYYTQAFIGDKKKEGFGLGLYIVESILKKHNSVLKYEYENGKNHFKVLI